MGIPTCIPDLRLDVKTKNEYFPGANELLTVDVHIVNYGEDAFYATFFMRIPTDLDYNRMQNIGEPGDTSYNCTVDSNNIFCDIGNPFSAGKGVNFKVFMEPSR